MKKFLFLILFISAQSWGDTFEIPDSKASTPTTAPYTIETTKDSSIYGGYSEQDLNKLLFVLGQNASGTVTPSTVYIPFYDEHLNIYFNGVDDGSNIKFSLFVRESATSTPTNTLPSYNGASSNPSIIQHEFSITNTLTQDIYLYAALVDLSSSGTLHILSINTNPIYYSLLKISRNTSENYIVNLNIFTLCVNAQNPCQGLKYDDLTDITQYIKDNVKVYFFLSDQQQLSQSLNASDYPHGINFKYILSNSVSSTPPTIDSVAKGDERVKVNFSGKGINYLNDVIAVKHPVTASATEQTFYDALLDGGVVASSDNGAQISGSLILKNLVNGETVQIGIAYVNKFYFASEISETDVQTPEMIQTFIQEKECYLLSAGFQKDHYILEYFRGFRDNFLLKNNWGRSFVKWYYRTAPYYAGIIYDNSFLRFVVRSLGYLAYYTLRFFPILISLLGIFLIIFTLKRFSFIRK